MRVLYINLALRVAMLVFVLVSGHWDSGDSARYLTSAADVCGGKWGGDIWLTPLYYWLLCALSPGVSGTPTAMSLVAPLLLQTLLVWLAGAWLLKRAPRPVALCWLFDPGLLIFPTLILTDTLFSVCLLGLGGALWACLEKTTPAKAAALGVALGLAMLTRSLGVPLAALTAVVLVVYNLRGRIRWRESLLVATVSLAVVSPRLYWNITRHDFWGLTNQAATWIESVAGVVEYHGQGLDPYQSEAKWVETYGHKDTPAAYRALFQNWPRWLWLSGKGIARVLVGHLNVEWAHFFTGVSPIGPGWFKVAEVRAGSRVDSTAALVGWAAGLLFFAGYCLWVYRRVWVALRARARNAGWRQTLDAFTLWALGAIFFLAAAPQVWGDARFRLALWPLVLLVWWRACRARP